MAHKKRNSPRPSSILLLATIRREPSRTAFRFSTSRAAPPLCAQGREKGAPAIQQFPAIDGCSLLSAESTGAFSCPSAQSSYSPAFAARLGGPPGKDDVRAKERALSSSIFHFGSIRGLPARLFGGGGGAHHKAFPPRSPFLKAPLSPFLFPPPPRVTRPYLLS